MRFLKAMNFSSDLLVCSRLSFCLSEFVFESILRFSPSLTLAIYAKSSDKSNVRMWFSPFCNHYLCDVFACRSFHVSAKMRKGRQGCGLVAKSLKGGGKSHAGFYENNFLNFPFIFFLQKCGNRFHGIQ